MRGLIARFWTHRESWSHSLKFRVRGGRRDLQMLLSATVLLYWPPVIRMPIYPYSARRNPVHVFQLIVSLDDPSFGVCAMNLHTSRSFSSVHRPPLFAVSYLASHAL